MTGMEWIALGIGIAILASFAVFGWMLTRH